MFAAIAGMFAAIAGMFAAVITGLILKRTGSYQPILIWASMSYLTVLAGICIFIPKLGRIEMELPGLP
jgi:hypothetical protein